MAATALDVMATTAGSYPASFAVSAGSNRIAFVACVRSSGTDATPETSATLGGRTMSVLATVDDPGNTFDVAMTVFYLLEADIALMSGSTFTPSGGSGGAISAVYWSVKDAAQAPPAFNSAATNAISGSVSLARVANSMTYGVTVHDVGSATNFSSLANPSEDGEITTTNMSVAYGEEADTARTASFSWTAGFTRDNVTIVINVGPVTGLSITSVNAGNDVYSGQTLVKVVGTGLSNVTSASYKGAACTSISKSSSLSITMTFPNFFTNNIKVGAQHALKVRG
jgi:hypothetical protein